MVCAPNFTYKVVSSTASRRKQATPGFVRLKLPFFCVQKLSIRLENRWSRSLFHLPMWHCLSYLRIPSREGGQKEIDTLCPFDFRAILLSNKFSGLLTKPSLGALKEKQLVGTPRKSECWSWGQAPRQWNQEWPLPLGDLWGESAGELSREAMSRPGFWPGWAALHHSSGPQCPP